MYGLALSGVLMSIYLHPKVQNSLNYGSALCSPGKAPSWNWREFNLWFPPTYKTS